MKKENKSEPQKSTKKDPVLKIFGIISSGINKILAKYDPADQILLLMGGLLFLSLMLGSLALLFIFIIGLGLIIDVVTNHKIRKVLFKVFKKK